MQGRSKVESQCGESSLSPSRSPLRGGDLNRVDSSACEASACVRVLQMGWQSVRAVRVTRRASPVGCVGGTTSGDLHRLV